MKIIRKILGKNKKKKTATITWLHKYAHPLCKWRRDRVQNEPITFDLTFESNYHAAVIDETIPINPPK